VSYNLVDLFSESDTTGRRLLMIYIL